MTEEELIESVMLLKLGYKLQNEYKNRVVRDLPKQGCAKKDSIQDTNTRGDLNVEDTR